MAFSPLGLFDWATCVAVASTVLVAEEARKLALRGLRVLRPTEPARPLSA